MEILKDDIEHAGHSACGGSPADGAEAGGKREGVLCAEEGGGREEAGREM